MEEGQVQPQSLADQITSLVQRQVEPKEGEVQTKPLEVTNHSPGVTSTLESRVNSIRNHGQPLPEPVRSFFEPRFGYDFSQVRVHTDSKAGEAAASVNARAFTKGRDVVFGAGQYSPGTFSGRQLLAHELTHVMQQRGQKSSMNPVIQTAQVAENIRHPERLRVIRGAERRVPSVIRSAIYVLERFKTGQANAGQQRAVSDSFSIDPSSPEWESQTQQVIDTFNEAESIISSSDCLISAPPGFNGWGQMDDSVVPPFQWGIQVGTAFFLGHPTPTRLAGAMEGCRSPNDMGFLRALTLIHEAIHWIHGAGHGYGPTPPAPRLELGLGNRTRFRPRIRLFTPNLQLGQETLTPQISLEPPRKPHIENPYRYEMLVFWLRCGRSAARYSERMSEGL